MIYPTAGYIGRSDLNLKINHLLHIGMFSKKHLNDITEHHLQKNH